MGTDFTGLFNEWAQTYDQTVTGGDIQYKEVFRFYDEILNEVVQHSKGNVVEFGVGTGNLSKRLLESGLSVTGIEPSIKMREKAAEKLPALTLLAGDFLSFPPLQNDVDSIVSTYAFHHLTDEEKGTAFHLYKELLSKNGRIVFADTTFETEEKKQQMIQIAEDKGYNRLVEDLRSEFYTTLPTLSQIAEDAGFCISFKPLNQFVWLFVAEKLNK